MCALDFVTWVAVMVVLSLVFLSHSLLIFIFCRHFFHPQKEILQITMKTFFKLKILIFFWLSFYFASTLLKSPSLFFFGSLRFLFVKVKKHSLPSSNKIGTAWAKTSSSIFFQSKIINSSSPNSQSDHFLSLSPQQFNTKKNLLNGKTYDRGGRGKKPRRGWTLLYFYPRNSNLKRDWELEWEKKN